MESRNHWEAKCIGGSGEGGGMTSQVEMPSAHQIIQKLENDGKDDGVKDILEIVNDKEQMSVEEINAAEKAAQEALKKKVFIDDVDDGAEEEPQHMVGNADENTE